MTLKQLVEGYKGSIEFVVKKLDGEELVEVVSFHNAEIDAIKDAILNTNVSRFSVIVNQKNLSVNVQIEVVLETPEEP